MRKPGIVHRDTNPEIAPRPLRCGDVVRDRHFPTAISVFAYATGTHLVFSQGDNRWPISCVKHGLEHADGAPIDLASLERAS